jgi:hypothetical protein
MKSNFDKVHRFQNQAAHIITRALKPTWLNKTENISDLPSMKNRQACRILEVDKIQEANSSK